MTKTWIPVVALVVSPLVAWSAEKAKTHVAMDRLSPAVKATIERESTGAKVYGVQKETEGGRTFYEAQTLKNGRESSIYVSEGGKVLKRGTSRQRPNAEPDEHEEQSEAMR